MSIDTIRTADAWFKTYWCGCGNGDPGTVLRDYLAVFHRRGYFLDPIAATNFADKYGDNVLDMLGYLLGGAGLIGHSVSVNLSAWLTPLGMEVKARVDAGKFGEDG